MKRRKFFYHVGLGSLGFLCAHHALASDPTPPQTSQQLNLETFEFEVTTVNQAGQVQQNKKQIALFFSESLSNTQNLEMVAVAPGKFWMGASPLESQAKRHEFPRHRVTLSSFLISKYPITQAQWATVAALPKVRRDLNPEPSHFQGEEHPVESVSWLEAVEFCDRLSQDTGRRYQLPSEAQWEYACRAGTQTPFHTGKTITNKLADYVSTYTYQAETAGNYRQATMPVGRLGANAFGLHDLHGLVWEWCADNWHPSYQGAPTDGRAWIEARYLPMRTLRGGSWLDAPAQIRSASRSGYLETALNRTIGFRVALV